MLPEPFTFIAVPIWIFSVGYPGTERLWLLRGLRDQPFTLDQVFKRNWSYLGRYLRLGLLLILPFAVVVILVWLAVNRTYVGFFVGLSVIALLADFALTFVTPALAFSTRRAREALSIGLRMIRSEWPQDALYVLIPPMAILIVAQLVPTVASLHRFRETMKAFNAGGRPPSISESSRLVSASFSALAAMIGLLFKGATAAFYSRRFPVPAYGASSGPEDLPRLPPRPDTVA